MDRSRAILIRTAVAVAVLGPLALAAASPYLQWRGPVYVAAGFAGILAFGLMFLQPLLIAGRLPDLSPPAGRRLHRWVGGTIVAAVLVHVGGLWVTSPPDVVDALLFRSPTPFSAWGVAALAALLAVAALAPIRRRLGPRRWRIVHAVLAAIIIGGTIVHAYQIEGTMETTSKIALAVLVAGASAMVLAGLRYRGRGGA